MKQQRGDHYAVLGVARDATPAEITHAYRMLLRRHHPDTRADDEATPTGAAEAELQRIITAYAVLRNPESRARYDQLDGPTPITPAYRQPGRPAATRPPIVAGPVHWRPSPS